MPANVIDHEKWKKAKKLAAEQGHTEDYAYIAGIYKKMGGDYSTAKSFAYADAMDSAGDEIEKQDREFMQKALALPTFVIPGQVPRQSMPPGLEALTGMPRPVDMAKERLAFTEPVLRAEGITKGLPMEATRANAFQKFVTDQLAKSSNEAEFRMKLFQHLHYDMKEPDPTLRRALVQRSLSFYKSKGKSAQTPITARRVQGFRMEKSAATTHFQKADPRGGKYHRRVTNPDTGTHRYYYSEADYQKRGDAHVSGADAKRAAAKRVIMEHLGDGEQTVDSLRSLIAHADPAMLAEIVKQCVDAGELEHDNGVLRKKQIQKGALPVMQSPEMQKQKAKAQSAQLEAAGIKTPVKAEHDRQKAEEQKEAEQSGAPMEKSIVDDAEGLRLWLLEKGAPGAVGAGHKYVRRIPKPGGGFTYIYAGQEGASPGPQGGGVGAPKPPPKPLSTMEIGGTQIHKFAPGEEPKLAPEHLDKEGRPTKRHWVAHHPNQPTFAQGGTAAKYGTDPKTGIPSDPARAKLHDEIIAKHTEHVPSVGPDKKPVAVVTMGGPASGKTTALKHLGFAGRKDFVTVDPDGIKTGEAHLGTKGLPEFHEAASMGHLADGTPASASDAAAVVHDESSYIADRVRDKAVKGRKNVIIDGTGKNAQKHIDLVKHLKEQGYHVHLVMPHQTADNAKKLNEGRAAATGRKVPESIVDEAYSKIPHNFEAVAKHAHEATLFNAKDGFPPKMVYSKNADGSETHHDPEFMKDFRAQHGPDKMKKSLTETFTMKKIQKAEKPPAVDVSKMIDEAFAQAKPHDEGSLLEGMDHPAAHDDTHIEHGIKTGRIKQGK